MIGGDGKFKITLRLSGVAYSLVIARKDEEMYRLAEKNVNELVAKYKQTFKADPEQYLAMVALKLSLDNVSHQFNDVENKSVTELKELEEILDAHIEASSK